MRKNWIVYQFFRVVIVKVGLKFFYRKVIIEGRENVPKKKPILFLPNHQNSFMDAFLVVTNTSSFTYFLTRAKAFKPPLMGAFIRSLNMLPVYRVRDGLSSVTKNNAIFEQCVQYLKRKDAILVFPEANHDLKRRIRPLSKGFTRIAFDAEVQDNWEMGLEVIPVGINYSDHRRSRNDIRVVFGKPIHMKDYKDLYEKDEREATENLKRQVSHQMKELTMHVPNLDHYPLHDMLITQIEKDTNKVISPTIANSRVAKIEEAVTEKILETAKKVDEVSKKFNISVRVITGYKKPTLSYILLFPLYIFSWLNNIIPYQPVRKITSEIIKDHAFDISIKFLAGLFLFPIFWIVISSLLWLFGVPTMIIWIYLGLGASTAVLFKNANLPFREMKEKKRLRELEKSHPEEFQAFVNGIKELNEFRAKALSL